MRDRIAQRVRCDAVDDTRLFNTLREPPFAPEICDALAGDRRLRQQVLRLLAATEQDFAEVRCNGNRIDNARASVLKEKIGRQANRVQRTANLPQLRINALAKNAVNWTTTTETADDGLDCFHRGR